MRRSRWIVATLAAFVTTVAPVGASLDELARAGDWETVLRVARRRAEQLPLRPEEALIAAEAARHLDDAAAARAYLELASAAGGLREVATVLLARRIATEEPDRAVELAGSVLHRGMPWSLREGAVEALETAVASGAADDSRVAVGRIADSQPTSLRRRLEVVLAASARDGGRRELGRLLGRSVRDLPALRAARLLAVSSGEPLTAEEQWRVAQALYWHAFYSEALDRARGLETSAARSVAAHEVLYLLGRCAFRLERWEEAASRYAEAAARSPSRRRASEMERHRARALELGGRLDEAAAAAARAVSLDSTDDSRLLLARLRLRQDRPDRALTGISRMRGRSARERGQLLLALDEVRRGLVDDALRRLGSIRHRRWRGPAAVVAAGLLLDRGAAGDALAVLDEAAPGLDAYWAEAGRRLIARAPDEVVAAWRRRTAGDLEGAAGRFAEATLGRWARLETSGDVLVDLRRQAAAVAGLDAGPGVARPEGQTAGRLWGAGLEELAARWDPSDFPGGTALESWWTALAFDRLDAPWRAIRAADQAWRQATTALPVRALPEDLRRPLYPLPWEAEVRAAARVASVPWPLLAGVAREESRWNPEAVSAVGARGLTQLMPATAAAAAALIGDTPPAPDDLHRPAVGLRYGAAELGRLLEIFGGREEVAVAAYNAGEPQARLWLHECGPGCSESDYLLTVSFTATRGYTEDVLVAARAYEELYGTRDGADDGRPPTPAPSTPVPIH